MISSVASRRYLAWAGGGCFLLYLALYLIPLDMRPLIIPDESRYAEIPREMLDTGEWITPHLNGLRYFEKPVLGYWLTAGSIGFLGENAFAVRFPSALAVGITALVIYRLLRRSNPSSRAGLLAAALYLTSIEVFAIGTSNILDSVFALSTTVSLATMFMASQEGTPRRRRLLFAAAGLSMGLGFLTKGFLALGIPAFVFIPYAIWTKRTRTFLATCWPAIAGAGAVILPWALAIHLEEGDFWNYFFWTEHINRFMGSEPQHPEPIWFFLPVILAGALPATALLPAALAGLTRDRLKSDFARFCVCWFAVPFLLLSISRGKLITYILPCYPPLIIILSLGIIGYFSDGKLRAFNRGAAGLTTVLAVFTAGLILSQVFDTPIPRIFSPAENWKWVVGVSGLTIWILLLLAAIGRDKPRNKLALFCAAPVALLFCSHFIFPAAAQTGKAPGHFLLSQLHKLDSNAVLVSDSYCVSALCWYCDRSDILLLESQGELEYGLSYSDDAGRFLSFDGFRKLIEKASTGRLFLVLDVDRYLEYRPFLPRPTAVKTGNGFVLAEFSFPPPSPSTYRADEASSTKPRDGLSRDNSPPRKKHGFRKGANV